MEKTNTLKSTLSFMFFTLLILAMGFVLLQSWSTASAGYIDKVATEVCLSSGKGGEVCFPENTCSGRCLLNPGTSGAANNPAGDIGKPFADLMDSFYVQITDRTGNPAGKNYEVCFKNPGKLYVYGLTGQTWRPIETSMNDAKGKYCAVIDFGDLGVNAGLSFAYFK